MTIDSSINYDLSAAGMDEFLMPRRSLDHPTNAISQEYPERDDLAIEGEILGPLSDHFRIETVAQNNEVIMSPGCPEVEDVLIETAAADVEEHGAPHSEEFIAEVDASTQPEELVEREVEEADEEEYPWWLVDEDQNAYYASRDRILRLIDQLDKEDRWDYLTQVENILRTGVRKRIRRFQQEKQ